MENKSHVLKVLFVEWLLKDSGVRWREKVAWEPGLAPLSSCVVSHHVGLPYDGSHFFGGDYCHDPIFSGLVCPTIGARELENVK